MKHHLILVPGLLCDATVWEHQTQDLADIAEIFIPDHGALASLGDMAEAILAAAPTRFALAGHSMGGRVALEVFRRAPDRISALALLDTGFKGRAAGADGEREKAQRYRLLDKAKAEGMFAMGVDWLRPMVHPSRHSDEALMKAMHDMVARKTPEIFAAQIHALLERPDASELLGLIQCPALVLCGRQDAWSTLPQHEDIASRIPGSHLVVIEEAGHMATMERPLEVTQALRKWLDAIGGAPVPR